MLSNLEDAYLRERAADLQDIGKRWLYNVANIDIVDLSSLPANTVIVAKDLTPSDTAQVDLENVLAFVTEIGGKTAHSSIMARSLELPAVVGTGNICSLAKNEDIIIVDALLGEVILNPSQEELENYQVKQNNFLQEKEILKQLKNKAAISKDGIEVGVWCNIGSPKDVKGVLNNGGQGIGLYRTEFLFMNNDRFPTEEEQFEAYKEVAMALEGKPVTIRTMDIGGDKSLPYMQLPKEENPFLGWRAIRRSEEHTSELQSRQYLVCRLLLEKKKQKYNRYLHSKTKHQTTCHINSYDLCNILKKTITMPHITLPITNLILCKPVFCDCTT